MRIPKNWIKVFGILFAINLITYLLIVAYPEAALELASTWWGMLLLPLVVYAWPVLLVIKWTSMVLQQAALAIAFISFFWLIVVPAMWATIWWGALKFIRKFRKAK